MGTDEQLKEFLNMTAEYLYADWEHILFEAPSDHEDKWWRSKYPQWLYRHILAPEKIEAAIQAHSDAVARNQDVHYNQDNDYMKQYSPIAEAVSHQTQSDFQLQHSHKHLDPLQMHFIRNA